MKKKYNRPVSKVIELDVQDLMAGSSGSPNLSNEFSDPNEETLAKRNAFLEDDFEEE